ncbi:MarR family winged helix-turn-helix transcriptional regulator [Novosphingobium pentaromativorans]|uniref:MarR family transcriptional regulator n=1 Tax=Novosphingobium pentaromativorans US6-1 TaxID=1088721 RepID=G6E764_9SPHN|nr:MarR family winged helix-turn-helix transcriptional regulator [Novosphingobium pentaromativorans]AIT81740.1 MarR family transcriptional regulator [Novosphingobium pentaromativorans US6-1]EHJ62891.1 MarR family transcriptional regulator [Novosphingobium pentaromativorans US6-1]
MSKEPRLPQPTAADPFADFLCFSVYSTGLAFNRLYKPLLDRYGLTYLQYLALIALALRGEQTVSELGESLFLESSTVTPLIKRLEAAGTVTRRRDTRDERVVRVSLTDQGMTILQEARCVPLEVMEATGTPPEQLQQLNEQLKALRSKLVAKPG